MDEGRVHLVARLRLEVSSGEDGQDFTKSSPGNVKSGDNDAATAPTGAYHVTQVAERGLHIKHGAINIHLRHWSAVDGPTLSTDCTLAETMLEFGDTLLQRVHNVYHIISSEEPPWHTSAELAWKRFQQQDEL